MWYMNLLYSNLVPDFILVPVVRRFIHRNVKRLERRKFSDGENQRRKLLGTLERSPIAIHTHLPNVQHYELPPEFFGLILGKRLKYSCCYWPAEISTLDESEDKMLDLTCQRAQIENGMTVLDLGCGWGSLTLWIAERFPACKILALSNSREQTEYIQNIARIKGFQNISTLAADVNAMRLDRQFDRILSIEMFEHMKNYRRLMQVIHQHLNPGGKLFVHIFSHRTFSYEFKAEDTGNWMAQTFFTGGTMPSDDLLLHYQEDLTLIDHWRLSGLHYAKTLHAWQEKMDRQKVQVRKILADTYGRKQMMRWWVNWRLFFLACEATWAYRGGREYIVSHYLFEKRTSRI